jgi:hypothetical protein
MAVTCGVLISISGRSDSLNVANTKLNKAVGPLETKFQKLKVKINGSKCHITVFSK